MTPWKRLWMMGLCAVCLCGAAGLLHTMSVSAQQSTQPPDDDGILYISASVYVDQSYNVWVDDYLISEIGDYYLDYIDLYVNLYEDNTFITDGDDPGDDPAELQGDFGPFTPGHNYSNNAYGTACFEDDDGEDGGDDYCDQIPAYASVYVQSPPPLIKNLNPSSVTQGDQGTLTITGTNFIENLEISSP